MLITEKHHLIPQITFAYNQWLEFAHNEAIFHLSANSHLRRFSTVYHIGVALLPKELCVIHRRVSFTLNFLSQVIYKNVKGAQSQHQPLLKLHLLHGPWALVCIHYPGLTSL